MGKVHRGVNVLLTGLLTKLSPLSKSGHRQVKNRRDKIELNKMITKSKVIKKII